MGLTCHSIGKMRSILKKIDNDNERRAKEDRKSLKKKNNK